MNKYFFSVIILIDVIPFFVLGKESAVYGYDKSLNKVYVKDGGEITTFTFQENDARNPAYGFDFFYGFPAIISDSRSLHDSTTYASLTYREKKINIDCFFYEVKSKQNGIFLKKEFVV
ncbi:MAG: hypothetical protein XXXJIFNMEKO3_02672 [Candidatus Erwinia impunctatus]|nr:hypothetical protein XXXJIFNMEKO_02672 [Culicoides impunctatus]